ncbi:glycosyltransferase family 1 protein [Fischerella thermalis CCMEE 5268]|uniref:Glycosyltransferase family 1 protein n=2 Tax=Fischerella thermalis TaxID=372787 RepID=A0A2N6LIY0_9CYAN|nr:glycosyltransferase family 4 protein [Fischerella thermalis]PLZ97791.1 glycosyltransferase family 1 protein [Fischerella thermalis CCMEE 5268]PMB24241.1 glycosyltransferase family 1 protein [Fischerella thermalis CCMEE 5318]PMB44720.1 glycosyltransferase family 1 protein [Fischerella thermalis CCMEE 5205]
MKILHVCAIADTATTLLQPQLKYFLSHKLTVGVACSPGSAIEELEQNGFKVHPVQIDRKISLIPNLRSIYHLTKIIRQNQYDLVHVHTPIAAVLGRVAAKLAGVKRIVYTSHGLPFHDLSSPIQYRFYFAVEKLTALITDLIISQNYEDIATAKKLGMCPPEKICYLGNGIDIDRFKCDRLNPTHQFELRKSLGIPDTANFIIGTIGRLTRKKGSGYLIEAAAKLLPEFPNLHIVIIGAQLDSDPEPFQAELIDKIHTLGIQDRVTLTGDRRDIPEILGLLDIFTLPTFTHEGLPRSILEAMAMKLPVVATDIRGCREAVVHGKTGFIVPPKNSEKLAEALRSLLANPQLRQSYGEAGRRRVETEYDERFVFQRLMDFYQALGITFADQKLSEKSSLIN